jgi:hypothetical protein
MKVNLHIERLVLDGLPISRSQGALVQRAVEAELSRLLAADGLAPSLLAGGAMPYAPGGPMRLTNESNPDHLGTQIAQSVYGGLGK